MKDPLKALFDFCHPYFHQYIDEFLGSKEFKELKNPEYWDYIGAFASYCQSCGYWEV